MKVRLGAALACAAVLISAGAAPAQTTMAPTAVPVVGPTASATKAPGMTPDATPAPGGAMMTMPMPAGTLAIDARGLTARRTATGFMLGGQAEVKDGCQGARFDFFPGHIFPPQFNLDQFRRPGTMGMMCIQKRHVGHRGAARGRRIENSADGDRAHAKARVRRPDPLT